MIDDRITCNSCGAQLKITNQNNKYLSCDFCGVVVLNKTLPTDILEINKSEIISSSLLGKPDKIIFIDRGINDFNQILKLYSDPQIDSIREVVLRGNNLISLKKISRFKLNYLDVSNNDIIIIDDFPRLEEEYYSFKYKTIREGITIDLRFNKNLTGFETFVLEKINRFSNIDLFELIINGCNSYVYNDLSMINFLNIIDEDGGKVRIIVDVNIKLPQSLLLIGFIEKNEEIKIDDYEDMHVIKVWELHRVIEQKIKIGNGSIKSLDKKKVDQIFKLLKSSNEPKAIELAKKLFDINDYFAKDLINEIKATSHYFPNVNQKSNNSCFIATAAMGDYNHPIVMDLRSFRDNWILKHRWGMNFISWYYKHSPKVAKVIEKSIILRKLTYFIIVRPIHFISKIIN
jgi:hypothetical protein